MRFEDPTYEGMVPDLLTILELGVAIIVACSPIIRPLFDRMIRSIKSMFLHDRPQEPTFKTSQGSEEPSYLEQPQPSGMHWAEKMHKSLVLVQSEATSEYLRDEQHKDWHEERYGREPAQEKTNEQGHTGQAVLTTSTTSLNIGQAL